jgi:hypothetical protein
MTRRSNGTRQDDPLEVMDELADEMENAPDDWDVDTGVQHMTMAPVTGTGRWEAAKPPPSSWPERFARSGAILFGAITAGRHVLALAILALAFVAWLRWGR